VSLTPLIDVVFILLIFFMLATSFADERRLPLASRAIGASPAAPVAQLLVRADGVLLDGAPTTLPDAARRLAADPRRRVVVEAGRDAPLQAVVDSIAALRAAGARDVSVARP
jgi:biopolymer transport protein ExbD